MPDASIDGAAEALVRHLLHDLPARQPVARDALDRLPSPVAHLLHARLNAHVDRDATLPETLWINRGHAAIREVQPSWQEAVRAAAQIPVDAWEDALAETARLAIAHLVQPAATLAAHAFGDDSRVGDELATPDPLPTPLVLDRLRVFGPYPYLIEIVERYVEKKGLGHIDRDGLERLLLRIDNRMVAGFSADEWLTLLDPLFDLLEGHVSAPLLQLAFEARGHRQLVAGLDGDAVSRDALHMHLVATLTGDGAQDEESVSAPQFDDAPVVAAPAVAESLATEPAVEPTASELSPEEIPFAPDLVPDPELLSEPDALDELATNPTPMDRPTMAHSFEVEPRRPAPAPPVIGSKFKAPEEVAPDDSDVLGPARPVEIVEAMEPMVSLDAPTASITDAVVTETMEETTSSGDDPLWKRLAGTDSETAPPPPAAAEAAPLWAQFSQETPTPPIASSAPSQPAAASLGPAPAVQPTFRTDASLETLELAVFGASDADRRAWYTAELFSGNADDYRNTLLQLDAARTWTEATKILERGMIRKHSVRIYDDPCVTFTDAVEAQMEAR
ncbi:MAG: hypothetical protein Rubg2KO_01770 [Rubricoccaceae bacterium]